MGPCRILKGWHECCSNFRAQQFCTEGCCFQGSYPTCPWRYSIQFACGKPKDHFCNPGRSFRRPAPKFEKLQLQWSTTKQNTSKRKSMRCCEAKEYFLWTLQSGFS